MIVRHFINWVRTAPVRERATGTRGLALAWLNFQIDDEERTAAEGALLMMLDDASPLVRRALADVFAYSLDAPSAIVHALSHDQFAVSEPILEFSPLLVDADLVDLVATGGSEVQCAIARRDNLPAAVCGAIAEVGTADAALALIDNPTARLVPLSWDRIVARHGHRAEVREALLALEGLPATIRLTLAEKLSQMLSRFVLARSWMSAERVEHVVGVALHRTAITIAVEAEAETMPALVRHLCAAGQLTPSLLLRALMSGNVNLVAHAVAELTDMPAARVSTLLVGGSQPSVEALLTRAGLPATALPAFLAALDSLEELEGGDAARLRRRTCERVLAICNEDPDAEDSLLVMLRRFVTEAQREEARVLCDELAEEFQAWRAARLSAA